MSSQTKYPLTFTCFDCKEESTYPSALDQGQPLEGATTLVKRCTNCGKENKINLPKGWVANRTETITRGLKKE